jgi:hypothetical protein
MFVIPDLFLMIKIEIYLQTQQTPKLEAHVPEAEPPAREMLYEGDIVRASRSSLSLFIW